MEIRVEMHFEKADIPALKRVRELLALLNDASFCVVSQLGLVYGGN